MRFFELSAGLERAFRGRFELRSRFRADATVSTNSRFPVGVSMSAARASGFVVADLVNNIFDVGCTFHATHPDTAPTSEVRNTLLARSPKTGTEPEPGHDLGSGSDSGGREANVARFALFARRCSPASPQARVSIGRLGLCPRASKIRLQRRCCNGAERAPRGMLGRSGNGGEMTYKF